MKRLLQRLSRTSLVGGALRTWAELDALERAVLVGALVLHGIALGWGLPSSDAWDNDGVAPRDVLPGLVETFAPGKHYTYPPLQLLIVALASLPASLVALARAKSFAQADVVAAFLDVRVMTTITVVARALALAASLGIVLAMGELARLLAGSAAKRARAFGMAIAAVEVSHTYYAQTSNLDVPYLFWASVSLVVFAKALAEDRPERLTRAAALAALAIATKDQAYALFLLSLPLLAALWAWTRRGATTGAGSSSALVKQALKASAVGVGLVLFVDGALFNPTGFLARVRFLLGPASQDFAQYAKSFDGRLDAFIDTWKPMPEHYPWPIVPLVASGLALAVARPAQAEGREKDRARLVALLPALGALSFTLAFNCWARRVEERFIMPQMLLVGVYAAVALGRAEAATRARGGGAARAAFVGVAALTFGWALRMSASVDATMLRDPRYEAEAWLATHARPEDTIEVYGMNVYLPRFAPWMHVVRVGTEPVGRRGPMPGITEVEAHYGAIDARNPKFVVVGEGFAWRYLIGEWGGDGGRVQPVIHRENLADHDARDHFHKLWSGTGRYATALHAKYTSSLFPIVRMHGSLGAEVWVFERRD